MSGGENVGEIGKWGLGNHDDDDDDDDEGDNSDDDGEVEKW